MQKKRRKLVWSKKDIGFLKKNYDLMTFRELAEALGISIASVANKGIELKLKRTPRTTKVWWTKEQLEYLRENYPTKPADDLREFLPYSSPTIIRKARELGIEKDGSFRRVEYSGRFVNSYKMKQHAKAKVLSGGMAREQEVQEEQKMHTI